LTEIWLVPIDFATGGEFATRVGDPSPTDVLADIDVDPGRSATRRADCLSPSSAQLADCSISPRSGVHRLSSVLV